MTAPLAAPSPTVSVVICSVDRASVTEAVASALDQDRPPVEVLIVFDRADGLVPYPLPDDPRVTILHTTGSCGAAAARQLGVERARGDLVAFLDDDDVWLPAKLARQTEEYVRVRATGAPHVLVSCRAELVTPDGLVRAVAPAHPYQPGTDAAEWLFVRHELFGGGFGLASSTLLCDTALARAVPWATDVRLHEDWDWVLRATRAGAALEVVPEALLRYRLQPVGTAGSRPRAGWTASADWATRTPMSDRARGDFLLCVSAVNAASYRQLGPALGLARRAAREGRPTARAWLAFGLQLVLPPRLAAAGAERARRISARLARLRGAPA